MKEDRLDRIERILERIAKEQQGFAKEIKEMQTLKEYIRNLAQTVGDLTGGWGKFVEGIAFPAVVNLANSINLSIDKMFWHAKGKSEKAKQKDKYCEVDLILAGKINKKGEFLLAVEIKSTFESDDANKFLSILNDFHSYFKELSNYKVIGVAAAARFGNGIDIFLLKKGIYVLKPSDGILEIIKPKKLTIFPI